MRNFWEGYLQGMSLPNNILKDILRSLNFVLYFGEADRESPLGKEMREKEGKEKRRQKGKERGKEKRKKFTEVGRLKKKNLFIRGILAAQPKDCTYPHYQVSL